MIATVRPWATSWETTTGCRSAARPWALPVAIEVSRHLGDDADLVRSLGAIPMFAADGADGWREVWD
jgi:hypothetical protein